MTQQLMHRRIVVGVATLLTVVLIAALATAAISARAENNEPTVTAEFLIGNGTSGNEFPDNFRAQYRLQFGEADSGAMGMRKNHVSNVHDASKVRMLSLDFDPGAAVPWHTHPGPLVVAIAEGALTVTWSSDCEPRTYEAGQAFVDLGQEPHMAENLLTDENTLVYIMGIGIPDDVPITNLAEGEFC
jgi:quercetin dioxygenase-like cupin family protein